MATAFAVDKVTISARLCSVSLCTALTYSEGLYIGLTVLL